MYEAFRRFTLSSLKPKTLVEGPFNGSRTVYRLPSLFTMLYHRRSHHCLTSLKLCCAVPMFPSNRTDIVNYIYIYMAMYMDVDMYMYMYISMDIYIYIYIYIYLYIYIYIYIYLYIYIYIYGYIYIYIYIFVFWVECLS